MATGRAGERERFVRDFLRYHGARIEGSPRGPFVAELPPALSRRLRAKRLSLAFRVVDLAEHPDAVLMVPGNPFFDRMVRLARRAGGVSRRYLRRDRALDPKDRLPETGPLAAARLGPPVYRSRLLFTFRVAYRAFEGFDDIRSIVVEAPSGRAADGRDFFRKLNLADEPEAGVEPADAVDIGAMLRTALADLERRISPTVSRFAQQAEVQLARETDRLSQFYTALIAEEKTKLERRGVPESVAAAEQKVEWVKRVDRETRLFAPRVTVTVLGLEEVWVPVSPLSLVPPETEAKRKGGGDGNGSLGEGTGDGIPGEGGDGLLEADLDLASGEIVGPGCQVCGTEPGQPELCVGHHLVCRECLQECKRCRSSFCLLCLQAPAVAGGGGLCYDAAAPDWQTSALCPACAGAGVGS
jgi:hypothetical protein